MTQTCLFTPLPSADTAAWAQATVGAIAIVVGALVVVWQVRRGRLEVSEKEARLHDSLARLLDHLKIKAVEARTEKRKLERLPLGHPAEPSSKFKDLADLIQRYPLEAINAELPLEALLNAQRAAKEMWPLLSPEPELDVNASSESTFRMYIDLLEQQISTLRNEARRLSSGKRSRHAGPLSNSRS